MKTFYLLLFVIFSYSCQQEKGVAPVIYPNLMEIPKGFPEIKFPVDNNFSMARWELGKKLFYDPILSANNKISCASCHLPKFAFSDEQTVSLGVEDRMGTRNTPSIANVAYSPYFTFEGGVPTLEMQIQVPIQEHNEFDFNIVLIAELLKEDSIYVLMSREAYDREVDAFVITRAIACFERSLLSGNSPYDLYIQHDNKEIMNESQIRGMDLFFSKKTNCSECHSGFNFTNYGFENIGLYEKYKDVGRYRLTKKKSDRALFKTPSLRNIGLTSPYMHDGSINTLEDVVTHFVTGGQNHPHKSNLIAPLDLNASEQQDLVQFLYALTDMTFINNPIFQPNK